jgi:endonuclease/exonuclease/phosphatase (EEP) superfamily protein YafD
MYKLAAANLVRTEQVDTLIAGIHSIGGPNVIVCGDFNDVPGCTSLRNLTSISGLKQVYPEVCCGPTYTFNTNRFYFRIDHVLYRGDLKPVEMVRGDIRCSDHYPLLTTFLLENNQ